MDFLGGNRGGGPALSKRGPSGGSGWVGAGLSSGGLGSGAGGKGGGVGEPHTLNAQRTTRSVRYGNEIAGLSHRHQQTDQHTLLGPHSLATMTSEQYQQHSLSQKRHYGISWRETHETVCRAVISY